MGNLCWYATLSTVLFLGIMAQESTNCSYTLVVNHVDAASCPRLLQQHKCKTKMVINDGQKGQQRSIPTRRDFLQLNYKLKQLQQRLEAETLRTNSVLSEIKPLKSLQDQMETFNPKQVQTTLGKLDQDNQDLVKQTNKYDRQFTHLERKLSNLMLDLNEMHKKMERHIETAGTGNEVKVFPVKSVTDSCNNTPGKGKIYRDCWELKQAGHNVSGVYYITPLYSARTIPVWCDMSTAPGGWLVFQRRADGKVHFSRGWDAYRKGFGDVNKDHWLGNDNLFVLTNQKDYIMRVDIWDFYGHRLSAEYGTFKVDGQRDQYKLTISNHTGPLPDGMTQHSGVGFSTPDQDNDQWEGYHCAKEWSAGWWFTNCWLSFLNGEYFHTTKVKYRGISWNAWKSEQLKKTEMKIRPADDI